LALVPAIAQAEAPAAPQAQTPADAQANPEILVTAQKRQQRTADVPLAISVLSAAEIDQLGLTESAQLAEQTPGLSWGGTTGRSMPNVFLRGVGNIDFQSGSNSPIGTYADGVYQGNSFGVAGLLMDLNRVEVLRGPQGTLWGKNTTGGIINYVPNLADVGAPANGHFQLGYGDYNNLGVDGAIGIPVNDWLAARVAVQYNREDGFFTSTNPATLGNVGGYGWFGTRVSLAARPTDDLKVTFWVSYSNLNGQPKPLKSEGLFDPTQPGAYAPCSLPNPGRLGTGCADAEGYVSPADPYKVAPSVQGIEQIKTVSPTLKLDWALGGVDIASITAYNKSSRNLFYDGDFTPSGLYEYSAQDRFHSFSQEVRVSSPARNRLSWIAGAYFYTDALNLYQGFNLPIYGNPVTGIDIQNNSQNYAAFADATYHVTDRLNLTGGLRLTHDERDAHGLAFLFNADTGSFNTRDEALARITSITGDFNPGERRTDTNLSGRAGIDYHIDKDTMIYANFSRGFKGGDINSGATVAAEFAITRPEFLTSYEAGLKTSLLDRKISFDISGYYYDYKDAQVYTEVPVDDNSLSVLSNAGKLRIYGFDGNVAIAPTPRVRANLGFAYINAKYLSYDSALVGTDYSGNIPPFVSKLQLNGNAEYRLPLAHDGQLEFQADGVFRTKVYFTAADDPILSQGGYLLLNASVAYHLPDHHTTIRAWVKNATDKLYLFSGYSFSFAGAYFLFPGDPRTYGVSARYEF
jgi:iron complex outermembrane receptor protein